MKCSSGGMFGHSEDNCKRRPKVIQRWVRKDNAQQSTMRLEQHEDQQQHHQDQNVQKSIEGFTIPRRTSKAPTITSQEVDVQNPFDTLMNETEIIVTAMTRYVVNADDGGNTSLICPNG